MGFPVVAAGRVVVVRVRVAGRVSQVALVLVVTLVALVVALVVTLVVVEARVGAHHRFVDAALVKVGGDRRVKVRLKDLSIVNKLISMN